MCVCLHACLFQFLFVQSQISCMRFYVQDKAAEEKHKENLIYKCQLIGLLAKVLSCIKMCTHGILSSSSCAVAKTVVFNADGGSDTRRSG